MRLEKETRSLEITGESTPLLQPSEKTIVNSKQFVAKNDSKGDETDSIKKEGNGGLVVEFDIHTATGSHIVVTTEKLPVDINVAKTTNMECLMHLLKGNTGVGILAMPMAYKNGGLWLSLAFVTVIGMTCTHCMHILVKCRNELCKRTKDNHLEYATVMEKAFTTRNDFLKYWGNAARKMVNIFLVTTQIGVCCTYIVFIADSLKQVLEYYEVTFIDTKLYIVMVTAALIPYSMVKSLKILAPFSAVANVLNFLGVILILVNLLQDIPDTRSRSSVSEWGNLPIFFGQVLYSFEGIGLVLPLHQNMKDQGDFLGKAGVLNLGLAIVVAFDNAVGFYGYLKYGDDTKGSITLNLPNDQWLFMAVKLMFATSIFLSYAIQFYVPINIISKYIKNRPTKKGCLSDTHLEYIIRLLLVLLTCGLSVLIPHLDLLIALIGACESSFLALILPAILELVTLECSAIVRVKNVLIMVLGLFGCIVGTYTSIVEIVQTF